MEDSGSIILLSENIQRIITRYHSGWRKLVWLKTWNKHELGHKTALNFNEGTIPWATYINHHGTQAQIEILYNYMSSQRKELEKLQVNW